MFDEKPSQDVKIMLIKLNNQEKGVNCKRLSFKRDKNLGFDFRVYNGFKEFFNSICYQSISVDTAGSDRFRGCARGAHTPYILSGKKFLIQFLLIISWATSIASMSSWPLPLLVFIHSYASKTPSSIYARSFTARCAPFKIKS